MVAIEPESISSRGGTRAQPLSAPQRRPMVHAMALSSRFDDVLAAAQHGSEWGWQQLLGEYGPAVQAYARTQGVTDPEDLLGQVLEGLVRGIDRLKGSEPAFRSWVFTIAHSRIIDDRRKARRRPQLSDRDIPDLAGPEIDLHEHSDAFARQAALQLLDQLPPKQRDVVALRTVAGLSVDQTARVLGQRAGSVRVSMHRAMQTLQKKSNGDVTP